MIFPPLIVNDDVALVNPKLGDADEVFPTVLILIVPDDMLNDADAEVTSRRLAKFIVAPSTMKLDVVAPPIAFPAAVPTLYVPAVIRSKPDIVGEAPCAVTVALALLSQKPPVAGIE